MIIFQVITRFAYHSEAIRQELEVKFSAQLSSFAVAPAHPEYFEAFVASDCIFLRWFQRFL